ncbi:SMI1/KNR4 family protein [Denitrobaculum tricleocarpae]|uniref:SMI1/KNR4 family protein n=1 Tax=Denitrobaculum tricleocarpae TaxID=2591009 RepID=A0A545TEY4_9PROT|nr:SMI1/KNR4 family protein [Denitrobaculum tricleocarpae]TQV75802.1 SMI1/KNR4 family protein [Denitrobaculum tricleocarpae]
MAFNLEEKYVAAAEEALQARLPDSYRSALQTENGGEVFAGNDWWELHPISDSSNRKRLSRSSNDIVRETASMREWTNWPAGALAIAQNGTGDALVLLKKASSFEPQVYVWKHEDGDLTEVAGDFSELERA